MYTSQTTSSSFTSLKRARDEKRFPPLPKLTSELILQVYTHISLRRLSDNGPEEYGDNERLIELGKAVLDALTTFVLFNKRPMLKVADIRYQRSQTFSDERVEEWVTAYGMRQRLRCHPDLFAALNTSKEARSIFYSYVGGIYVEHGPDTVREWITQLLRAEEEGFLESSEPAPRQRLETPPPKKIKSEEFSPTIFVGAQPPRSPPPKFIHSPPPHQAPPVIPNPLAPAQPSLPFLPLFNQTAAQRRVMVEYPAEFIGPPHAGRWTVRCIVNGIQKGVGSGSSKQVAKEEAARQAYYAMGWT